MIVLWQFEDCENSEPVRTRLTAQGVDFIAINAPKGHPEKDRMMRKLFGSAKTPALWDTQSGRLAQGTAKCLRLLDETLGPR